MLRHAVVFLERKKNYLKKKLQFVATCRLLAVSSKFFNSIANICWTFELLKKTFRRRDDGDDVEGLSCRRNYEEKVRKEVGYRVAPSSEK